MSPLCCCLRCTVVQTLIATADVTCCSHSILVGWNKLPASTGAGQFPIPACLDRLVEDGHFGRKTGKGFYNWDGDKIGAPN